MNRPIGHGSGLRVALMFFLPLTFYLLTCAPDVTEGDSPELAGAAWFIGVSHMGYPLHALAGKTMALLPFGTIGYRVVLLSALSIAGLIGVLGAGLMRARLLPDSLVPAYLSIACLPFIWREALGIEVYAPHLLMTVIFFRLLLEGTCCPDRQQLKFILAASFVMGLAFGIHISTVLWCVPWFVSMLFFVVQAKTSPTHNRSLLRSVPVWSGLCGLAAATGASVLLLVPLRANRGLPWNWNVADTLTGAIELFSGQSFRHAVMFSRDQSEQWRRFVDYLMSFPHDIPLVLLISGLVGAGLLYRTERRPVVYSCLTFALMELYYCMFLNQAPLTVTPFGLITKLMLVTAAFYAFNHVGDIAGTFKTTALLLCGVSVVLACGHMLVSDFSEIDQSDETIALRFTADVASSMDHAVLLVCEKDEIFPLLYAQTVEHAFPDTIIMHYLQVKQPSLWSIRLLDDIYAGQMRYKTLRTVLSSGLRPSAFSQDPVLDALHRFSVLTETSVATTFPDLLLYTPPGTAFQRGMTILTGANNAEADRCRVWRRLQLPAPGRPDGPLDQKYCTMLALAGNNAFVTGDETCYRTLLDLRYQVCLADDLASN